jgi:hypothetical protein
LPLTWGGPPRLVGREGLGAWGGKVYNLGRCPTSVSSTNTLARKIPHRVR